ncbi:PilW family protein [Piscinibacter sp.]|uniref:PilW family protein n=1 Tax=Piscinibacter sp. TaxID=1903157 RepID=UPI002CED5CDD|nr:PilW family protein [Albitalea sp.]HUG22271.1 PilW family protein [Albitalea sp.]
MKHPTHCSRPSAQRGVTLIELMVGLTLGLIIATALLMLFANASISGQNLNRASVQIENGRYVSELLAEDLRLAGFYGEANLTGVGYASPDPCSTAVASWSSSPYTVPTPVQGYAPDDALGCLLNRKAGTYALAVRRVAVSTTDVTTIPTVNTQNYVQYSFCTSDPSTTKLIFGTDKTLFTLKSRNCADANTVRAYMSRIYYVASCNDCSGDGDGVPTLKRVDLEGDQIVVRALADGIEELRFEYGFDTDADGSADVYLTTTEAVVGPTSLWENVMAIKVHFITRSLDKAVGSGLATAQEFQLGQTETLNVAADGYTRRAYSNVVRLINPSSVREAQ